MFLHLIKLCVGISSVDELIEWQQQKLKIISAASGENVLDHVTRQTPKQIEALHDASLYWVINREIACRQKLVRLEPTLKNNIPHCRLVLDPQTVRVHTRPQRPFQGWRYLKADDAPADVQIVSADNMNIELRRIGVI